MRDKYFDIETAYMSTEKGNSEFPENYDDEDYEELVDPTYLLIPIVLIILVFLINYGFNLKLLNG